MWGTTARVIRTMPKKFVSKIERACSIELSSAPAGPVLKPALFTSTDENPLRALAEAYLTSGHRDDPGAGCLLAALGPEVSRQSPAVRRAITDYVQSACDLLARLVPGKSKRARRQTVIATYATLVGAMVMARAVDDRVLSHEILDAGLASVTT